MKDKNKGRKIYKTKETNTYQKSVSSKIFSAGLTVLFLGGVVFIGYSSADQLMHLKKKKEISLMMLFSIVKWKQTCLHSQPSTI